jgi:hypothetical protein
MGSMQATDMRTTNAHQRHQRTTFSLSACGPLPAVALSVGTFLGIGAKLVAVPLSHVRLAGNKITVPHGSRQVRQRADVFMVAGPGGLATMSW